MQGRIFGIAVLLLAAGLAGCIGSDGDDIEPSSTTPASVDDAVGEIDIDTLDGTIQVGLATPAISFNAGGTYSFPLDRPANATGYVLELVWEATTPASESLDLWVRAQGEGTVPPEDPTDPLPANPVASTTGTSVLTLTLQEQDLPEDTPMEIFVRAPSGMGVGATVEQPFELHVSTFLDLPVDPGHSAVDA